MIAILLILVLIDTVETIALILLFVAYKATVEESRTLERTHHPSDAATQE